MNETTVPNLFPRVPLGEARLAVVGEAPGADEIVTGEPFVGTSGRLLRAILAASGIACDQVFFGNVCLHQPPGNEIDRFDFNGPEIQAGLERLRIDLQVFRPNCVLLLGKTAFRAWRPDLCYQSRKGYVVPLSDWRGSIHSPVSDGRYGLLESCKAVGTYHPAYILRAHGDMPYFKFDVARAVRHSRSVGITAPVRGGILRPSIDEVLAYIARIREERKRVTFDIEGYADDVGVTMLSLCTTPTDGIVIPFWLSGGNYWSVEDEVLVWQAVARLLADAEVPKVAHNAFYELFVLAWRHHCVVNHLADDTLMKVWEVHPELERSLAVSTSIYTEQPYYKDQRLSTDADAKLKYNLTDSQVTDEVNAATEVKLSVSPLSLAHYHFNVNLIPAYNYTMLRGCKLDTRKAAELRATVQSETDLLNQKLEVALHRKFNVKSVVDKRWLLYDHLGYTQLKRYGASTAEDVLLHYWTKEQNPVVRLVIRCIRKRTRLSDIGKLTPNTDGRIRSSYDLVGTNTGRLSSRSSIALQYDGKEWDNTGTNLQNVTKELRCCFIPDSLEHDFWQFDLSGADGWTVAADLAAVGHPAMLEDYLAGVKPALVLYYMLQEKSAGRDPVGVNRLDRTQLKVELRRIKSEIDALDGLTNAEGRPLDWQYLCCKRVQHGCVTGDHEVLTREGWITIDKLRDGQEVMTWENDHASWDVPSVVTRGLYSGQMVNLTGESCSLDMTKDHRVLYRTTNDYKTISAASLDTVRSARLPKGAETFAGLLPKENLIRLLAAFQADGCVGKGRACFHFAKERKVIRLQKLLDELEIKYEFYSCTDGTFVVEFFEENILRFGKATDWRMLKLDGQAMRWYLEESLFWDGCVTESYQHKRQELFTAVPMRAEVMHTMAHLCGMSGQLYLNHRVSGFGTTMSACSLNNRTEARVSSMKSHKYEAFNLPIYCVTVRSGYFMVRRQGKIIVTGNSNYGMAPDKLAETIFGDSDGTIVLSRADAAYYQYLYKLRYNTDARNESIRRTLADTGALVAACGIRRQFFGIRNRRLIDDSVVREAAAFGPQANTTYATNKALERLWYDPTNRTSRGTLHVEPLLQIHDALAGQNRGRDRAWCHTKLKEWFDNPMVIAGTKLTIPADGKWGTNWKDTTNKITD